MVVFEYRAFGLAGAGQGHVVGFGFEKVIPGISIENEQFAAAERTAHGPRRATASSNVG